MPKFLKVFLFSLAGGALGAALSSGVPYALLGPAVLDISSVRDPLFPAYLFVESWETFTAALVLALWIQKRRTTRLANALCDRRLADLRGAVDDAQVHLDAWEKELAAIREATS